MSTYENPLAVIDRESGKIWTNAINTLSNQYLKKQEKKEAEKNTEQKRMQQLFAQEADYILNNQEEFAKAANSNGMNNPSLFKAGKDLINDMAKATTKIKTAKTQELQQAALNEASELQKLYTDLVKIIKIGGDADKTYVGDRVNQGVEGWKKPGDQGGMSITGEQTSKFINRMNVRGGIGRGGSEDYVRKSDNSGWDLQYTGGVFGDSTTTVDALKSLSYDPGLVPDLKGQVDSIFSTDSGQGEDGKTFAILQKNGEYSEEYLDMKNTIFEDGSVDEDGSFRRTEIAPANSALIASTSTTQLNNLVNNYLASPDKANKIFMEVLPNNEKPLERALDGGITPKDAEIFRKQVLEYGRKQLPNYNVVGQETVIDYKKRLGSRINQIEKKVDKKENKTIEVVNTLVKDLVGDTESFLSRYFEEEDFAMSEGPGSKGFTINYVNKSGEVSNYTYDLTNPSDIERFFREELDDKLGTASEKSKILKELTKIAKDNKASTRNQTRTDTKKELQQKYNY